MRRNKKFHFDNVYYNSPLEYGHIKLYQIGDLYCDSGYEVPEHEQYCYEISYIVSGKGKFYTGDIGYSLSIGDIHICRPGDIHRVIADINDPFRYFYFGFSFNNYQGVYNEFEHIKKMFDCIDHPVTRDELNISAQFLGVFNEILQPREYSPTMVKTYLHQILILTYRNFFDDWTRQYAYDVLNSGAKHIVYQVINYIDNNLYDIYELPQIADAFGYNYSYLSRVFAEETGLTLQQYFNQKRHQEAIELLKQGNMTITQIGEKLNYQSIHSFSNAFRKMTGMSPAQYQGIYFKSQKKNRDK